jgi:uncharacterized protein (DUF427 family)
MADPPDNLHALRAQWRWRGQRRPPFALPTEPGQESVWDYPRPPIVVEESREVTIHWGTTGVACTRRALKILETSHPPCFYLPWADVARELLEPAAGSSFCEWKGPAHYWTLADPASLAGGRALAKVAWSYPRPLAGAERIADCVAFYPSALDCRVGGARVTAQPGGFYGGWITPELVGPFKGDPGSSGW